MYQVQILNTNQKATMNFLVKENDNFISALADAIKKLGYDMDMIDKEEETFMTNNGDEYAFIVYKMDFVDLSKK